MKSHVLSLLGLCAASAVAGTSNSRLQLLKHLHGDKIAEFAASYDRTEAETAVLETRDSSNSSHTFLDEKTKRKCGYSLYLADVVVPCVDNVRPLMDHDYPLRHDC